MPRGMVEESNLKSKPHPSHASFSKHFDPSLRLSAGDWDHYYSGDATVRASHKANYIPALRSNDRRVFLLDSNHRLLTTDHCPCPASKSTTRRFAMAAK